MPGLCTGMRKESGRFTDYRHRTTLKIWVNSKKMYIERLRLAGGFATVRFYLSPPLIGYCMAPVTTYLEDFLDTGIMRAESEVIR